jgi:nicotinamide-nucleotide amidase
VFPSALIEDARRLVDALRGRGLRLATAESCTGGLVVAALTEIPGASDVVERAFVTYSNAAKVGMLGVDFDLIVRHGAVSAEVALAMAAGALRASAAGIAVAVTGIAGPGGGSAEKPVGLVHLALAQTGLPTLHRERRFGDKGRSAVRMAAVAEALGLIRDGLAR